MESKKKSRGMIPQPVFAVSPAFPIFRVGCCFFHAGLLARASQLQAPSRFPSGCCLLLRAYSGGTAPDSHRLPSWPNCFGTWNLFIYTKSVPHWYMMRNPFKQKTTQGKLPCVAFSAYVIHLAAITCRLWLSCITSPLKAEGIAADRTPQAVLKMHEKPSHKFGRAFSLM